jgi:membrane peptidoglycan carboxypeptidase
VVRRSLPVLGALVLVAGVIGYVAWQRPGPPPPKPVVPKEVVLQYADGSRMWSTSEGRPRGLVVHRVLADLAAASLPLDSLVATGGVVRTTIDARAQSVAAAVLGRLVAPKRAYDPMNPDDRQDDKVDAAVTAIDPVSGGVRVYFPGFSWNHDLAGGVSKEPAPGLFEPLALVQDRGKTPVTPLDVTAAYATVAGGGVERKPHLITWVTAADGSSRYRAADAARPVVGPHVADRITAALKEKPVCNGVACVSGVSPWMVGYTPQLAVSVYLEKAGADDADLPRVIWQEFLAELAG